MSLLTIVIVIILAGLVLWAATTYIPMNATVKKILIVVVVAVIIIWLLQILGVHIPTIRVN